MERCRTGVSYLSSQERDGDAKLNLLYMRHRFQKAKSLYKKDLYAHYGCVNAIEFSSDGEWLISGGDDRRVLIWNVLKSLNGIHCPKAMKGEHNSNIFCLGFDSKHTKLFSAGNDEQVIMHDVQTGEPLDVFIHDEAVYGLSVDPWNSHVFASACDDGRILIWDIRESNMYDPFMLAGYSSAFHAVMYNPVEPRLIATANAKEGVGLWDIRKPRCCLLKYGGCLSNQSSMSVRFNSAGTHLIALRRRLPPVLYHISSPHPVAEFDHPGYYNSCTMKSCCFAGDKDQYVLSGSDDFRLYMWKIPDDIAHRKGIWVNEAQLILKGHRSIVNQVRYNDVNSLLVSSGVEKIVKLWSIFPMVGTYTGDKNCFDVDGRRRVYSHEEYINLVLESGQFMTHDYSHKSMQEDPRMMAFFDSLVQRDIEGWTSDSSDSSTNTDVLNTCFEVQSNSSSLSSSSSSEEDGEKESSSSGSLSPQTLSYITGLKNRVEATLQGKELLPPVIDSTGDNTTSDRISQLIAQKRHEQLLRTAKATLKFTKKHPKWFKKLAHNSENFDDGHWCLNNAKKILDKLLHGQHSKDSKDKRRLLQRKRARLLQRTLDSDISSDSDIKLDEVKETDVTHNSNSSSSVVTSPSKVTTAEKAEDSSKLNTKNGSMPDTSDSGSGNTREKVANSGLESEETVWVSFTSKCKKNSKRNYRRRNSSEDFPDD